MQMFGRINPFKLQKNTKRSYSSSSKQSPSAVPRYTTDFLQKLPKVDLHCHLDGSVRLSTVFDIAKRRNISFPGFPSGYFPTFEEISKKIELDVSCGSLEEFLTAFEYTLSVMQHKEDIQRIVREVAEDFAIQGTRYLELRFCPELHTNQGMKSSEVLEAVAEAADWVSSQFGRPFVNSEGKEYTYPLVRVIVCGLRNFGAKHTLEMAKLAVELSKQTDMIVAFDVAGAENTFPPRDYIEAFNHVKSNRLNLTIHAGEGTGWKYVEDAIECGADRIGHGIDLQQNEKLTQLVIDKQIPLEISITSNEFTKTSDLPSNPIRKYFDLGIPVIPCTDDVTMIRTNLTEEYSKLTNTFNFTPTEIVHLIDRSFKCAFLPEALRNNLAAIARSEAENLFVSQK